MNEPLYDVVIFEKTSHLVESIAGKAMRRFEGFHNAEKRLDTVLNRINDDYDAEIVPTGSVGMGEILPLPPFPSRTVAKSHP